LLPIKHCKYPALNAGQPKPVGASFSHIRLPLPSSNVAIAALLDGNDVPVVLEHGI